MLGRILGPLGNSRLLRGLQNRSLQRSVLELADTAERRAGAHADNLTVLALAWQDEKSLRVSGEAGEPDSINATGLEENGR